VEILEKKNSPVLLIQDMAQTNTFSLGHKQGCDAIREPEDNNARSVEPQSHNCYDLLSLRKHISTISKIVNLKDNKLDMLAKCLGHDI
jgi:hypothetical protein